MNYLLFSLLHKLSDHFIWDLSWIFAQGSEEVPELGLEAHPSSGRQREHVCLKGSNSRYMTPYP